MLTQKESIPKDKSILIKINEEWTIARYDLFDENFMYAKLVSLNDEEKPEYFYFENNVISEEEIKEWKLI